ncbi:MAG TPA: LuxR family transcriptional regulator [Micromonosporaceae bacterium]|nr:LuxR family transcriptional regulator [Micromonosporaceae bacterium]
MTASVFGRDAEQDTLRAFVTSSGPGLLLVTGPAGIGKTTLVRYAGEHARESGRRVLGFRPGQNEAALPFAGLAGLLPDGVLDVVRPSIPEVRRVALDTALARVDGAADPGLVGLGVLSALTALAAPGPLLLVVDDTQWLDAATVFALEFALRRLDGQVLLLAAVRSEDVAGTAPLEDAYPEERRSRLALGPLSIGALGRLVHERLDLALPRLAAVQLADESQGNPLVALELARAAASRHALPSPGERFMPAADVMTLMTGRIAGLDQPVRDALQVVATAARPSLPLLATVLGDREAEEALAALVAAQLVVVDGMTVRCAHPLIGTAAYAQLTPARRRGIHARLAVAVHGAEERARHLALGSDGPDEQVAAALDEAADRAARRGGSAAAAELSELAVGLTPDADPATLARRELGLARRRLDAGDPGAARTAAVRAVGLMPAGPARVDALLLLSAVEQEQGELAAARDWLTRALAEAGDDRAARARAHVTAGMTAWEDVGVERAHAVAAIEALTGHEAEDPTTAATALVLLAGTDFEAGQGLATELLDRAVALEPGTDLVTMMRPSTQRAIFIGHAGRLHDSITEISTCVTATAERGDHTSRPHLLRTLAWMELGAGRLRDALAHIDDAASTASELALDDAFIWAVAGHVRAALGMHDEAAALADRALARATATGNPWAELRARGAVGFGHLTADRPGEAAEVLAGADAIIEGAGLVEIGWQRLHGDLVEALVRVGRAAEAATKAEAFTVRAEATAHPWSLAIAARAGAQVAAAEGRADEAVDGYRAALAYPVMAEMPLERGRTLTDLGAVLRRANRRRDAREALDEAVAVLRGIGAVPWADRAAAELGTISGRASSPEDLTEMQRRVAVLAAKGRTNAEIAQELFVSVRTVETHLAAAYRKLGARSRTELAAMLR